MAVVGIALVEIGARDAVERGEKDLRLEIELGQRGARRARQRLDIDGIVVIGRGDAQGRLPAQALQRLERLVADRRRRRRAILGIERNDENAVAALFLQRFEALGDRRLAVAHRPVDLDASLARPGRQRVAEPFRLGAGDRFQRAFVAFAVPDRSIVAPPGGWPSRQDDEVEDRPPDEPAASRRRAGRTGIP